MAKVKYSGLVTSINGKLSDSTLATSRGINYIKKTGRPSIKPSSLKQSEIRGLTSTLSGYWYSLAQTNKDLWNSYGSSISPGIPGFSAFMKLNMVLINAFGLSHLISFPPSTPSTPAHVLGVTCICYGNGSFDINWSSPFNSNLFIFCNYRPILSRYKTSSQPWKFGFTCSSLLEHKDISTGYENSRPVDFRLHTFDLFGRVSPSSHIFRSSLFSIYYIVDSLGNNYVDSLNNRYFLRR